MIYTINFQLAFYFKKKIIKKKFYKYIIFFKIITSKHIQQVTLKDKYMIKTLKKATSENPDRTDRIEKPDKLKVKEEKYESYQVISVKKMKNELDMIEREQDLLCELVKIHLHKEMDHLIKTVCGNKDQIYCPEYYYCFVRILKKGNITFVDHKPGKTPVKNEKIVRKPCIKGTFYTNGVPLCAFIKGFNSFMRNFKDNEEIIILKNDYEIKNESHKVEYIIVFEDF